MNCLQRIVWAALWCALATCAHAAIGNAWHIPDNTTDLGGTAMRSPTYEIGPTTVITVYQGVYKGDGANQTGGWLIYRGISGTTTGAWSSAALIWHSDVWPNQYWKQTINAASFGTNDVIQYYVKVTFSNRDDTYLYGGDSASNATGSEATAQANPYSIRNRPAWLFHADNRVLSGNDVQFWVKVGYVSKDSSWRWANAGAVYYTTNGATPTGSLGVPGTNTFVAPLSFSHSENDTSVAGNGMWWVGSVTNLPSFTTIKYKIGLWHTGNNEEKFADYRAGTNNRIFSFSIGTVGDPVLTVNGLSANYTTSKFYVDEIAGDSYPLYIVFQPNAANVSNGTVQVFTNLNRRDRAGLDADGDGIEDGIKPPSGDLVGTDDTHYYRAYTMTDNGGGTYSLTLYAQKTGAYRLTARYQTTDQPGVWKYYTSSGRRDHAITVSPKKALDMTLYELNTLTVEATDNTQNGRSTFVDLLGAADGDTDGFDPFHLDYLNFLQVNCLWFQPIHPVGMERAEGYTPGSPYATRDYFAVAHTMGTYFNEENALDEFTNFVAKCDAYTGSVGTINIMLDGVFNHTSWDARMGQGGVDLGFTTNKYARIGSVRPGWYARLTDYCQPATYYNSAWDNDFATAPDRGDFGKWSDVTELFFGQYAALVCHNPEDNGNYLNEGDWFNYGSMSQNVIDLWRYFAYYTEYWLAKTGHPGTNSWVQALDDKGIDALRCDFGQGLPPQCWEYIINKTRSRKWNFVFMAETLDGGIPGYRSNRHFDILNENLVFKFTQEHINNCWDLRAALEQRRSNYRSGAILLNLTSHDEVLPDNDPWLVASRYGALSSVDGLPMIFYGQEKGIQNYNPDSCCWYYDGFKTDHELNFGKRIPHFKQWNKLTVWENPPPYAGGLDQWYGRVNWARLNSPALRSQNRYFLSRMAGGDNAQIFAVAKYETAGAGPNNADVVLGFANLLRHGEPHSLAADTYNLQGPWSLLGLKTNRLYNVRNLASSDAFAYVWANPVAGSNLWNNGIYVSLPADIGGPITRDGALVQYLKLVDVTPPPPPGTPYTLKAYAIGNQVTFNWTAINDPDGGTPSYRLVVGTTPGGNDVFDGNVGNVTNYTVSGSIGQTLYARVYALNAAGVQGAASSTSSGVLLLSPTSDYDGDGMTNQAEDIAGTNPLDAASLFAIANIRRLPDGSIELTWNSVAGKTYELWATTNLASGFSCIPGCPVISSGGTVTTHTNSAPASQFEFYRIRVRP